MRSEIEIAYDGMDLLIERLSGNNWDGSIYQADFRGHDPDSIV